MVVLPPLPMQIIWRGRARQPNLASYATALPRPQIQRCGAGAQCQIQLRRDLATMLASCCLSGRIDSPSDSSLTNHGKSRSPSLSLSPSLFWSIGPQVAAVGGGGGGDGGWWWLQRHRRWGEGSIEEQGTCGSSLLSTRMGSVGGSHGGVVVAGNRGACGAWDFIFFIFFRNVCHAPQKVHDKENKCGFMVL